LNRALTGFLRIVELDFLQREKSHRLKKRGGFCENPGPWEVFGIAVGRQSRVLSLEADVNYPELASESLEKGFLTCIFTNSVAFCSTSSIASAAS
jgi:hypothetical protein